MSFWPFSISLSNHTQLQKFLDLVQDISTVTVDDLILDSNLLRELISELHDIKGNYNNNISNFQVLQSQKSEANSITSDVNSISSSNNENNGSSGTSNRDNRGVKLLELLLQPHILNGFLDYIFRSVEFYYKIELEEENKLNDLVRTDGDKMSSTSEVCKNEDSNDVDETEDDEEDSENEEDRMRRLTQASAEILSIDLWVILNRIIETPVIISKLWLILTLPNLKESSPSVSYIIQILDQLLERNSIELFNFIRRQENLAEIIIDKIEIPVLADFFLRIIQSDKVDSPTGILEALSLQKLIPKLIDILKPDPSLFQRNDELSVSPLFFRQTSVTEFLKSLITISSNTALAVVLESNVGPNQLIRELVSPKIVNTMIHDIMLYDYDNRGSPGFVSNKHGINNCVSIVIELIRKNNSDYDSNCSAYASQLLGTDNTTGEVDSFSMFQWLKDFEQNPPGPRDPIYLGDMLELFSDNLDKFTALMNLDPDPLLNVTTKYLGFSKFKISELIAELLHCSNMILLNSNRLRKIVKIRDAVRLQQGKRLQDALNENILFDEDKDEDDFIDDVTTTLDYIILDDNLKNESDKNRMSKILEAIENEDDSEDEEPLISPENPFVCRARDEKIRENSFVGDYFKIKLKDLGLLINIVLKFTKFPWHNFFHNVVFDLVQQIFNGKLNSYNSFLIVELFDSKKCNLTNIIVNSYTDDTELRPGYMGHLILISEEIVKFTSLYKPDLISPLILESISTAGWEWFVNETLLKTREAYNVVLGAEQNDDENNGNDDEERYGFDASTVGYLDMEPYDNQKNVIVLGDSSNHDDFINETDRSSDRAQSSFKDDCAENPTMSFSKIKALSPKLTTSHDDFSSKFDEEFLNNHQDSNVSEDSHELRRVPKHHSKK